MKDILNREIKVGDIVAHGTRSGNSGDIGVKIVTALREEPIRYNRSYNREEAKVINYRYTDSQWDKEAGKYVDMPGRFEKGGTGWAQGNLLIVNESVPEELKKFLRSLI